MIKKACPACVTDKDLFGAEPFDPFTCGAADFPPDIQSKLDEMQVSMKREVHGSH